MAKFKESSCMKNIMNCPCDYKASQNEEVSVKVLYQWLLCFNRRMTRKNRSILLLLATNVQNIIMKAMITVAVSWDSISSTVIHNFSSKGALAQRNLLQTRITLTGESYKDKWITQMNSTVSLITSMSTILNNLQMIMLEKMWFFWALSAE
jgi:hypothetical protein